MKPDQYRTIQAAAMTEAQLQAAVIQLAKALRWLVFHAYDARRSQAGFPDLTMARYGRLIFAELKTEKGRLTRPQREWALQLTGRYYLWRPSHLLAGEIVEALR